MYDILELKSKLLPSLQEIAKNLNIPKYRSLKKMDLIYQILDFQAINPSVTKQKKTNLNTSKSNNTVIQNQHIMHSKSMEAPNTNKETKLTSNNEKIGQKETVRPTQKVIRTRRKNETQLDNIKKSEKRDSESNNTVQNKNQHDKQLKVNDSIQRNRQNHQRNQHNSRNENRPSVEFEFEGIITSEGVLEIMPDG